MLLEADDNFRAQWLQFFPPKIKYQQELDVNEGYLIPVWLGETTQILEYSELWTGRLQWGRHNIPGVPKDSEVSILVFPLPTVSSDLTIRKILAPEHPVLIRYHAKFNFPGVSVVVTESLNSSIWNGILDRIDRSSAEGVPALSIEVWHQWWSLVSTECLAPDVLNEA
jgi:hypothetical protein